MKPQFQSHCSLLHQLRKYQPGDWVMFFGLLWYETDVKWNSFNLFRCERGLWLFESAREAFSASITTLAGFDTDASKSKKGLQLDEGLL